MSREPGGAGEARAPRQAAGAADARPTPRRRAGDAAQPTPSGTAFRDPTAEWLEADGLGGFASGCASGVRTRRYHALLVAATTPPTGRFALVQDVEAWVETDAGAFALSSHRYAPDVIHPDGASRVTGFDHEPWPRWRFELPDGTTIEHERWVPHGRAEVVLTWRRVGGTGRALLAARPLLSGRDLHALHHENDAFRFHAEIDGALVKWRPYDGVPAVAASSNGAYTPGPDWYRGFLYVEECARGLDHVEDLASPGTFAFDLEAGEAVLMFAADAGGEVAGALAAGRSVMAVPAAGANARAPRRTAVTTAEDVIELVASLREAERRRRAKFASPLHRAADAYIVRRGEGRTIVAGYPWFTDWGRDTFIALRGLCVAGDRLDDARAILLEWSGAVSEGMLPNRFAERGDAPEYNSVDASLWYVIAVDEWLETMDRVGHSITPADRKRLSDAVLAILDAYTRGTHYGIRMDEDGLLAAGVPGVPLTWMDVKFGDWVATPRVGKPVEVQALWLNALAASRRFTDRWNETFQRGRRVFEDRFWNEADGSLYDVVDVDHVPGAVDASIRPNQLLAIGGLPVQIMNGERSRRVLETVERVLWTPLGPRTLAPGSPGYAARYEGDAWQRDSAYHQGTVWPWLAGALVEAWVRVRGSTPEAKHEARERFVAPLLAHLATAGLGHVSEVADAEPPFTPRGCPFQAWSVGELLRLERSVLAETEPVSGKTAHGAAARRTDVTGAAT